jgi:hypothetical protein
LQCKNLFNPLFLSDDENIFAVADCKHFFEDKLNAYISEL